VFAVVVESAGRFADSDHADDADAQGDPDVTEVESAAVGSAGFGPVWAAGSLAGRGAAGWRGGAS
jgi:hypothetical protein